MNTRPDACKRCRRPLRPSKSTSTRYPGTVQHYARGHCGACYRRLIAGKPGLPQFAGRLYDVDEVVVELAVDGSRVHLNAAERRIAVQQLTQRHVPAELIARMVGCTPRHVTRLRSAPPLPQIEIPEYDAA